MCPCRGSWEGIGGQVSELLLVGATGLGREILASVRSSGRYDVVGFVDGDEEMVGTEIDGAPVLGTIDDSIHHPHTFFLVCLESGRLRQSVVERLGALGIHGNRFATVIDSSVRLPGGCRLGRGSVLLQNVLLTASVTLGSHVVAMPGVIFAHDDAVGDYATLAAGTAIGGDVRIGRAAYLGMNCSVRGGASIGQNSTIGMGAAVLEDVPDGETWAGVPARPVDHNALEGAAATL